MTNPDEVKDKLYDDLDSIISATPHTDKRIILGGFNARVGTDYQAWEGVIGSEGVGICTSNCLLLLRKCAKHDLLITNAVFNLPIRTRHPECIPDPNIGISYTMSKCGEQMDRLLE